VNPVACSADKSPDLRTYLHRAFDIDELDEGETIAIVTEGEYDGKATYRAVSGTDKLLKSMARSKNTEATYFCVSTVQAVEAGKKLGRGKADCRTAYVVALDDIGNTEKVASVPPVEPSAKLETSAGNFQWHYFINPYDVSAPDGLAHYKACLEALAAAKLTDPGALGAHRIMRMPGSVNTKPGRDSFQTRVTEYHPDRVWDLDGLMEDFGLEPKPKSEHVKTTDTAPPPDWDVIIDALKHIPPGDPRSTWRNVGMALKTVTDDVTLWDEWSSGRLAGIEVPTNYDAGDVQTQWPGFKTGGDDKIGIGSLIRLAKRAGWKPPADWKPRPSVDTAAAFGATAGATYERMPGFQLVRAGDLKVRPLDWLVSGLFERDSLMLLFGDPGTGKSFWALDLASCIAAHKDHHGRKVQTGPVVYVAGEGFNGITRRLKAWSIKNQIELAKLPLYVSNMPAAVTDVKNVSTLMGEIQGTGEPPALVIFDTLARNFGPADENSTPDMTAFVRNCDQIRVAYGCTVMLVHHSGHGDKSRSRGSSVLQGAVDTAFQLNQDGVTIRVKATKVKDGPLPEPFDFEFRTVALGMKNDDGTAATSAVLQPVNIELRERNRVGWTLDKVLRAIIPAVTSPFTRTGETGVRLMSLLSDDVRPIKKSTLSTRLECYPKPTDPPQHVVVGETRYKCWAVRNKTENNQIEYHYAEV
jgi:hypothetical protein